MYIYIYEYFHIKLLSPRAPTSLLPLQLSTVAAGLDHDFNKTHGIINAF